MATQYNTCLNPLVVDLVSGQLMTTSDAIAGGSPQILDLQNDTIMPASELPVPASCGAGACNDSSCPYGLEITRLAMITEVTMTGTGTNKVNVTLVSAVYSGTDGGTTAYTLNLGYPGAPNVPLTIGILSVITIGAVPNGKFKGVVTQAASGATMNVWITVQSGILTACQASRKITPDVDVSCEIYPDYTASLTDIVSVTNPSLAISESTITILGEIVNNETYGAGTYGYTESGTYSGDLDTVQTIIESSYTSASLGAMLARGILQTQCIEP